MAAQNAIAILVQGYSTEQGSDPGQFLSDLLANLQQAYRCTCFKPHERPLHYLLAHGSEDEITSVMKLVTTTKELRSQVLEENSEQRNILHEAACSGTTQAIRAVAKYLTEDNIVHLSTHIDCDQETPLETAAFLQKVESFEVLLQIIPQHRKLEVVEYLHHGRKFPTMLHLLVSKDCYNNLLGSLAQQLKEKKCFLQVKNFSSLSNTPFHIIAGRKDCKSCLENLCELVNSDDCQTFLEYQDSNGDTPLHIGAHKGNVEFFKAVLCEREKVFPDELLKVVDKNNNSPLHCAAKLGTVNHQECLNAALTNVSSDSISDFLLNMQGERGSVIDTANHFHNEQFCTDALGYLCGSLENKNRRFSRNKYFIDLVTKKAAYGHVGVIKGCMKLNEPAEQLVSLILPISYIRENFNNCETYRDGMKAMIQEKVSFLTTEHQNKSIPDLESHIRCLYAEFPSKSRERESLTRLFDVLMPLVVRDKLHQDALGWKDSRGYTILHIAAEIAHSDAIKKLAGFGQWEYLVEKDRSLLANLQDSIEKSQYDVAKEVKDDIANQLESFGLQDKDKYLRVFETGLQVRCLVFVSTDRISWEEEVEHIKRFCIKFGIKYNCCKDLTSEDMIEEIHLMKKTEPSCLIVMLFYHGEGGRIETKDSIMPLRDISVAMAEDFHYAPKVLIVQACMNTAEAGPSSQNESSDEEIAEEIATHIDSSMKVPDENLEKIRAKYKRPKNVKQLQQLKPKTKKARNSNHDDMEVCLFKTAYALGGIADQALRINKTGKNADKAAQEVEQTAKDAIALVGKACQYARHNDPSLCPHHCNWLQKKSGNGVINHDKEVARGKDGYIRCGHMFEELPRHFLCLMATTTGEAERLLMASKLNELADKKVEKGNSVDLETLFSEVRRQVDYESDQVAITGVTLTKRLCLPLKTNVAQASE